MNEINTLNIPAFRRKRSLAQKARKKTKIETKISRNEISEVNDTINIPLDPESNENEFEPRTLRSRSKIIEMAICGTCDGYFDKIKVAVVRVTSPIRTGDILLFETTSGLFQQEIASMQQNKKDIRLARTGSDIGLKVALEPKVGGNVYKQI